MEKKYRVFDSEGHFVSKFATYNEAFGFKMLANRPDWKISLAREYKRKVTDRMKKAIAFIESITPYNFNGDIEEFSEVSDFIGSYLDYAKEMKNELLSCGDIIMEYYD
nr:MAG TPA: hypothetical protein [Caudoviricetes sp.]